MHFENWNFKFNAMKQTKNFFNVNRNGVYQSVLLRYMKIQCLDLLTTSNFVNEKPSSCGKDLQITYLE